MSLKDYTGPGNSNDIFQHLVEETITAAFQDQNGRIYLVMSGGDALVVSSSGYFKEPKHEVLKLVGEKRREIEGKLAELRGLAGVKLP